jgi:hypothetical protein
MQVRGRPPAATLVRRLGCLLGCQRSVQARRIAGFARLLTTSGADAPGFGLRFWLFRCGRRDSARSGGRSRMTDTLGQLGGAIQRPVHRDSQPEGAIRRVLLYEIYTKDFWRRIHRQFAKGEDQRQIEVDFNELWQHRTQIAAGCLWGMFIVSEAAGGVLVWTLLSVGWIPSGGYPGFAWYNALGFLLGLGALIVVLASRRVWIHFAKWAVVLFLIYVIATLGGFAYQYFLITLGPRIFRRPSRTHEPHEP